MTAKSTLNPPAFIQHCLMCYTVYRRSFKKPATDYYREEIMLLIKNVYLYDPASGKEGQTDLLIEDGKFSRIGPDLSPDVPANSKDSGSPLQIIDGSGLCAAPGLIDTPMNDVLTSEDKAVLADEIPLGRFGRPEEIAKAAYFLTGPDSSYITGQVIRADGAFL